MIDPWLKVSEIVSYSNSMRGKDKGGHNRVTRPHQLSNSNALQIMAK